MTRPLGNIRRQTDCLFRLTRRPCDAEINKTVRFGRAEVPRSGGAFLLNQTLSIVGALECAPIAF